MWASDDRSGPSPAPASAREASELVGVVFEHLNHAGVRWALLRGRATLGLPGGDVDLLVSADDLDSFEDVVFELGGFTLPRLRVPGSWSRAVLRPSWHRFYVLTDASSSGSVKLDVVTQLVYSKRLKLASNLERGCLDRRLEDGMMHVLDPSDTFWTVLLHCLLDKQKVTPNRAAELESALATMRRPSPGEDFFETLCPPGCSADAAISLVRNRDWDALADVGRVILRSAGTPANDGAPEPPTLTPQLETRPRAGGKAHPVPHLTRVLRTAAVSAYPLIWRRAGLGVVPRVLDIVEEGAVDATVLLLTRRPARCAVYLLTTEEQQASLGALLRAAHYIPVSGRWHRLTRVGLEKVHLVTAEQLGISTAEVNRLREESLPMAGRTHCRRAAGPARLDDLLHLRGRAGHE